MIRRFYAVCFSCLAGALLLSCGSDRSGNEVAEQRSSVGASREGRHQVRAGAAAVIDPAGPAGEGRRPGGSLTVLLDGSRSVDPSYCVGGDQPSVILSIDEADGRRGILLVDLARAGGALEQNLDAWMEGVGKGLGPFPRRALVLSHAHTFSHMLRSSEARSGARAAAEERLGPLVVQGPNLADLCGLAGVEPGWRRGSICERNRGLTPGLERLRWDDGTESGRVYLLTHAITPPEVASVPFQPLETLVVIEAPPGYLVYSVCAHRTCEPPTDEPPPVHAAYLVKHLMEEGRLAAGPIHTLVTGTCGMGRWMKEGSNGSERAGLSRLIEKMRDDLGIRRVFLSHCGLNPSLHGQLARVFGPAVRLALPGACLALSPETPKEDDGAGEAG